METDTKGTAELFNHAAYDIGDDGKRDGTTFAEQAVPLNYISKNSTGNDGGDITWTVHVNTILPVGFQNVTVTDTLPEGLVFDSATFQGDEITPEIDGDKLTFALTGAKLNDDLVIKTHVANYDLLKETKKFTNTAQLIIHEADYPPVTADATVNPPTVVSKGQVYTQESHPRVHYTIG